MTRRQDAPIGLVLQSPYEREVVVRGRCIAILGGGHTWPGGQQYLPRLIVGPVNRDLDATREMWSFFAAHPAPRPEGAEAAQGAASP